MRLSVITPTRGRRERTLKRLYSFLAEHLRAGDEHLIVWDCDLADLNFGLPPMRRAIHLFRRSKDSVFGNIQRDFAAMEASGDCLIYCDDDDMLTKEAIDILHAAPPEQGVCHAFWMQDGLEVYKDLAGGPQIVLPNQDDIPKWAADNRYEADKTIIKACKEKYRIVYHETVICNVRPREA